MNTRYFLLNSLPERLEAANLESFGEQVVLLKDRINVWNPDAVVDDIIERLVEFDYEPTVDYIVLSGKVLGLMYLTLAVVRYMKSNEMDDIAFNALVFDAFTREYRRVGVPIP